MGNQDQYGKNAVKLTITKLGIAACEAMFKTGVSIVDLPDSGGKMTVTTTLTHEPKPIDLSKVADTVNPLGSAERTREIHMYGPELGIEFLFRAEPEETVLDLIVRSLVFLEINNPKKIPSNFIVVRTHFNPAHDDMEYRNDSYYNYAIDHNDRKKIAEALKLQTKN